MSPRRRGERGSATPFMVIVALALLILGGLVVDGSGQLSARARAKAYAEEAARAAAQKIDPTKGFPTIIADEADAAIADYCAAIQAVDEDVRGCERTDIVEETGGSQLASVTVEVEIVYDPIMLGFVLSGPNAVSESATANPIQGIVEPELDAFVPPSPIVDTRPVDPGIPIESNTDTGGTVPTPEPECPPTDPPGPEDPPRPGEPGWPDNCETPPTTTPPPCKRPRCEDPPPCKRPRCETPPPDGDGRRD